MVSKYKVIADSGFIIVFYTPPPFCKYHRLSCINVYLTSSFPQVKSKILINICNHSIVIVLFFVI